MVPPEQHDAPGGSGGLGRKLLFASLGLTPIALGVHYLTGAAEVVVFALAAIALVPLAWLIGEATEQASEHTGPGISGFLNASFGNAPELIIAILAIRQGLPDIVRGSITGSIVSNLLLVLGVTMIAREGRVDTRSLKLQLRVVLVAAGAFLVPAIPGWSGDPERHSLFVLTVPVAVVLIVLYLGVSVFNLRQPRAASPEPPAEGGWTMQRSLVALGIATAATALVSEALVSTLASFGKALGLSEFFVAAVIVAIVGNAAEHGGAVVVARRDKTELASEIAIASSAQVAVFVAPVVALVSVLLGHDLPLSFRPVELAAIAAAAVIVMLTVRGGKSTHRGGMVLLAAYLMSAIAFGIAGDR